MRALLQVDYLGVAPPSHRTAFTAAAPRLPSASRNRSCVRICLNGFSGSFLHRPRSLRPTKCWPAMTSLSSAVALHDDGVQVKSSTSTSPLPSFGIIGDSTPFTPSSPPSLLVFSGGTAFNGVVEELKKFTTRVAHVLPVSDDGGSTAEIVRVLGGPAVGDIRSRCLRLSDESTPEALAVKTLLGYRLPLSEVEAKAEWYEILEGRHGLWQGVSGPYRETIRAFLVHFQTQIFRHSASGFSFGNGSVGNFFFAGARIFLQSLEAAIFLYSRVCQCPTESLVLPAICTNDRLTLGSELCNGTIIRGQNQISHPPAVIHENAVSKVKHASTALPSPIKRIFYMSSERSSFHEVYPIVNSVVLEQLSEVDSIVYAMGSLYTSICPSLILRGVGENIAKRRCPKILIINGSHDRETLGMAVSDFVISVSNALNRKFSKDPQHLLQLQPRQYINVILVPKGGEIPVDREKLDALRINTVIEVDTLIEDNAGIIFQPRALINALQIIIQADFEK